MKIYFCGLLTLIFLLIANPFLTAQEDGEDGDSKVDTTAPTDAKKQLAASKLDSDEKMLKMLTTSASKFNLQPRNQRGVRAMWYNVENLFDTENDSLVADEEFLPDGVKGWTQKRYQTKLNNIYKVMTAVGMGEIPEIVAFCEIENRKVLEDLIKRTPLRNENYDIVHENSPDARGIDVGLVYKKDKFQYIKHEAIRLTFSFDPKAKTRDILYVQGKVLGKDTLHIFVNHWPSRRGGQAKSEPRRIAAAELIRTKIDSLLAVSPNANVLIMGDLNDYPTDKSVKDVLRAKIDSATVGDADLYNYMSKFINDDKIGTHKYQGHWGTLDHLIVSSALFKGQRAGHLYSNQAEIFAARFLFEEDKRYYGLQPFRTYSGPRFIDGFSDHLPAYIDLLYKIDEKKEVKKVPKKQ
jgi:predicted extracellular nuclease